VGWLDTALFTIQHALTPISTYKLSKAENLLLSVLIFMMIIYVEQ
jgi:hypothetical protein